MTDKSIEDMTASELLRWVAKYSDITCQACKEMGLGCDDGKDRDHYCEKAFEHIADKIDAELAQARRSGLERAAKSWAEANGWPDFKEGEDFGAWLERCFIPRPRFEDGEPVHIGDKAEHPYTGETCTIDCINTFDDSYCLGFVDERSAALLDRERVKRPAPEVLLGDGKPVSKGETVYVIESGIERTVKDFGTKLCEGMGGWDGSPWVMFGNGSWMHARDLTHERPVLGVDGKPIAVGDEVWLDEKHSRYAGSSGSEGGYEYSLCGIERQEMLTVEDTHREVCGRDYIRVGMCNAWCHSSWLTHTPPDTQQKIDEDAEKFYCAYFGGYGACGTCPASAGELSKKSCKQQQILDLLRRQRELDKRTGGAE